MVTPVTFRRPVDVGRMAAQIDQLSSGRFVMGLGAGWNQPEHDAYGLDFPPTRERFDRLEDAINMMQALWSPGESSYHGRYYSLDRADCLPIPESGRPPILIGGGGEQRTIPMAARYAAEWNCVSLTPEAYGHKRDVMARACDAIDRDPDEIEHSMMMFHAVGPPALVEAGGRFAQGMFGRPGQALDEFLSEFGTMGRLVGGADQTVDALGRLAEAGVAESSSSTSCSTETTFPSSWPVTLPHRSPTSPLVAIPREPACERPTVADPLHGLPARRLHRGARRPRR